MTVPTTIDAAAWLGKYLEGADGDTDLARAMLGAFAEALMSAQASMQCNAGLRRAQRRAGELAQRLSAAALGHPGRLDRPGVPKLRRGVYSPEFLLQPRRRAEQALVAVVCAAYVEGVSTRRVDDLVKAMGIDGISKSEVSRLANELDKVVTEFRERPLDQGPYRYLWIDALTQRVREGGRVVNVSAVIATAVNAEGRREIVGFDIVTTEDTAAWTAFLRSLVARGLCGVELVISDAHGGIKAAIAQVFSEASWQRCRTHFMANLASRCAKGNWPMIATLVRSIFEQPDRDTTWSQLADVIDKLTQAGFCDVVTYLLDAADDILAFSAFPTEHWRRSAPTTPRSGSTRRSAGAPTWSGSSPTAAAVIRLVGALLAEQTDEWAITRRYMSAESLKAQQKLDASPEDPRPAIDVTGEEVTTRQRHVGSAIREQVDARDVAPHGLVHHSLGLNHDELNAYAKLISEGKPIRFVWKVTATQRYKNNAQDLAVACDHPGVRVHVVGWVVDGPVDQGVVGVGPERTKAELRSRPMASGGHIQTRRWATPRRTK